MRNPIFFQFSPGIGNESENKFSGKNEKDDSRNTSTEIKETKPKKTFLEKVKDALRDWSNKDERDRQYDDAHV